MRYHGRRRRRPRGRGKVNLYLIACAFLLMIIYFFTVFEMRIRPIIKSVAEARAKNVAVRAISDVVNNTMAECNLTYEDLIIFQKNDSQQVTAVTSNIVRINQLKAELTSKIESRMSETEALKTKVPLGTLLNQGLLAGTGPRIPIRLVPLGYAKIDIINEFSSAGINQTRHEIELNVTVSISVLLPGTSTSVEVQTQLPIAQTIIVGTVPDSYTNVEGAGGSQSDIVLEVME
jgi:sporulation protein YunB